MGRVTADHISPEPIEGTSGLRTTVIRGGTSRGVYVRETDLPQDPAARAAAVLRLFGGESRIYADGLAGENPVLRKAALVSPAEPGPDGSPAVRYRFGQVDESLGRVSHNVECGNVAAGVPLFAALEGWAPAPAPGGVTWITFVNTGRRARAEWLGVDGPGGRVRITFLDAAPPDEKDALPLGSPQESASARRSIAYSVVRGLNTYLFIRSADLGHPDPLHPEAAGPGVFDAVAPVVASVQERLGPDVTLKVCLVGADPDDAEAVRARILYVGERRTHPGFAVTGATTLALGWCVRGSVLDPGTPGPRGTALRIHHPAGTMALAWTPRADGLPDGIGIERTCRLIMRGLAY